VVKLGFSCLQYQAAAAEIEQHAPKDLPMDLFLVNCSEMNELLVQTTSALIKQVLAYVERCVDFFALHFFRSLSYLFSVGSFSFFAFLFVFMVCFVFVFICILFSLFTSSRMLPKTHYMPGLTMALSCHRWCNDINMDLIKRFKTLSARLLHRPSDSSELVTCESLFDTAAENELPVLEKEAVAATALTDFLFKYRFNVSDDTLQTVHTTFVWLAKMDDVMQTCSELLSKYDKTRCHVLRCSVCCIVVALVVVFGPCCFGSH
jgi:hypothetical protein